VQSNWAKYKKEFAWLHDPKLQPKTVILKREKTYVVRIQDLNSPVAVLKSTATLFARACNSALMYVRHSLNQRTHVRMTFDAATRVCNRSVYRRLQQVGLVLDCPTPEQAELAIDAILAFAQSLDGKWLAPAADLSNSQVPQPPIVSGLGADSPAISEGLDRADLTAAGELEETAAPPTPGQNPGRPGEGE
jgi:hypothetical protein